MFFPRDAAAELIINALVFMISFTFHEYMHAQTAYWLGDDTAYRLGRLTLNPVSHIDVVGFFCLLFLGFGWANPVPYWPGNFKHPRPYALITKLAGPCSNILLVILGLFCLHNFPHGLITLPAIHTTFIQLLRSLVWINAMLAVFNLLPIPPLDGGFILEIFLEDYFPQVITFLRVYGIFILLLLFTLPHTRIMLQNVVAMLVIAIGWLFGCPLTLY